MLQDMHTFAQEIQLLQCKFMNLKTNNWDMVKNLKSFKVFGRRPDRVGSGFFQLLQPGDGRNCRSSGCLWL